MASQYRRRSLMLNTIAKVAQGNPTIITDSSSRRLQKLNIYGQSSQDGTPSVENPIPIISKEVSEIKVTGKNLVDFKKVKALSGESQPFEILDCGYIIDTTNTIQYRISTLPCVLKAGKTYIINYKYEVLAGSIKDVPTYLPDTEQYLALNKPFIPKQDANRIGIYLQEEIHAKVKITNIQLEESESSSKYEPYKEQVVNLTSPITLRGIPLDNGGNVTIDGQQYIADVIKEKNGVIGVERNCYPREFKVAEMDSSEEYPGWNNVEDILNFAPPNINKIIPNKYICNIDNKGSQFLANTMGSNKTFILDYSLFNMPQSQIKEQYPDLIIKLVFQRLTPTFEPLPEEIQTQYKALKSYYPNTVIQTGCWNEVTYSAKRGG